MSAVNFTGDVVNGVPVISGLDLADVPPQTVSKYYMRAGELNGGHPVHIPIMVARGTPESLETGKKLSLSAEPGSRGATHLRAASRPSRDTQWHRYAL